jgi:hypothetical protein
MVFGVVLLSFVSVAISGNYTGSVVGHDDSSQALACSDGKTKASAAARDAQAGHFKVKNVSVHIGECNCSTKEYKHYDGSVDKAYDCEVSWGVDMEEGGW